jgi:hypothetical protein
MGKWLKFYLITAIIMRKLISIAAIGLMVGGASMYSIPLGLFLAGALLYAEIVTETMYARIAARPVQTKRR